LLIPVFPSLLGFKLTKSREFIWFQPGSESEELIEKAKDLGLKVIHNTCVMLETDKRK
ncbi:CoA-binding protein, partial [Caldanaerobacter subterraneus]|uniref:CoA-binding protein n=1 Tax=Caldanaerobacter subterraneus TaxID=911092 RepID=UPI003463D749